MAFADIIIPRGRSNVIAIDYVIASLKYKIPKAICDKGGKETDEE